MFAHDAVRLLRANGRPARRLAGGMPEWRLAGLPVATGTAQLARYWPAQGTGWRAAPPKG